MSVTTTTLKLPFKEAKNSFNMLIFLVKLVILKRQIEKAFSLNCLENILEFLKEKYRESIS